MTSSSLDCPGFFNEKLESSPKIRSAVDSSLSAVADILQISTLPFFTDYTDHGTRHLTTLIEIADKLIGEPTRELFTAEDAAVLIFSVLLHDLALHLSEGGFKSIVMPAQGEEHCESTDWGEAWDEFLSEARHWDDHKLVELFGCNETGAPIALVRDPFDHYGDLTESDRKLIGEFIRRHHAQLAYQFAVRGFPGYDGQIIQFGSFDEEFRELSGIVARSHGYPLRDCIHLCCIQANDALDGALTHRTELLVSGEHDAVLTRTVVSACLIVR